MKAVQVVAAGRPALEALAATVAATRAGDPFAPVTVLVPSNYAGLSLRRALAARAGLVNVRFLVFARVAAMLGAPTLAAAGQLPLTAALRAEVIRAALAETPGLLAPVAGHGATESALATTFADLREVPAGGLEAIAAQSPRAASVVALFRAFRARVAGRFYDDTDLARAAAAAIRAGAPALRDLGRVVLYQPGRIGPAEFECLRALDEAQLLEVILAATGEALGDEPLAPLARSFGCDLAGIALLPPPAPGRLALAPDVEEEVRVAIRAALQAIAGGTQAARIAILFRSADPYARIVHEQLAAAGLAGSGPGTERLAGTAAGRGLLTLLGLRAGGFRRDLVMEWLTAAPILGAEGTPVPAARWDALSRSAGVVGGEAQWRARLAAYAARLEEDRARMEGRGEDGRARGIAREQAQLPALLAFLEELFRALQPPQVATWAAWSAWARALFRRYFGTARQREHWAAPATDGPGGPPQLAAREAAAAIEEQIELLATLDAAAHRPTEQAFLRTLEALLGQSAARAGAVGSGIFVGELAVAAGMDFDAVFVLGASAGLLPPSPREDPLLPDRERRAGGGSVPLRLTHSAEERRAYLLALASAPQRTLSFARSSQRDQRRLLPAPWFRQAASALAGRELSTAEVERLPRSSWFEPVASFAQGLEEGLPLSLQEYELRALAGEGALDHPFLALAPALGRGLAAERARRSGDLTEWDGLLGPAAALLPSPERPFSPTSLEQYATCGMRYFLGNILRVSTSAAPESILELSALERGSLLHAILDQFFRENAAGLGPDDPWTPDLRARLAEVAGEHFRAAEAKGVAGKPVTWRISQERILRELQAVLTGDDARRREHRLRFARSELEFPGEQCGPVVIEVPGEAGVAFRGKIDRVDTTAAGGLRVADYKSGSARPYRDIATNPFDAGRRLQLPVYAAAARQAYGPGLPVHVEYLFTKEGENGGRPAGYDLSDAAWGRFLELLRRILAGIGAGSFPADPGGEGWPGIGKNCSYCDYDRLCPAARVKQWERKSSAPAAGPFLAVREAP